MRIVFFGSSTFGIPSLRGIYKARHHLIGVVTAQDKPQGRNRKINPTPVKLCAEELKLKIWQPENLNSTDFLKQMKDLKVDIFVVVAFRKLPPELFTIPEHGAYNLHASYLPEYRGAAPIQRALMAGETQTGLSLFKLKESIDTGDIAAQIRIPIAETDNYESLSRKLSQQGAKLILENLEKIDSGNLKLYPQKGKPSLAPKIKKEDKIINWEQTPQQICAHIKALSPYPCAQTQYKGRKYKIAQAQIYNPTHPQTPTQPGTWHTEGKKRLYVEGIHGYVEILCLQEEGRKMMNTLNFLQGKQGNI
ncbi:MAG: methionyl-tRNA formyltransferase [Cytophagales bacterium]|nr:methionyl-tRNA formyltransferase [Cytophagales bacterium]